MASTTTTCCYATRRTQILVVFRNSLVMITASTQQQRLCRYSGPKEMDQAPKETVIDQWADHCARHTHTGN